MTDDSRQAYTFIHLWAIPFTYDSLCGVFCARALSVLKGAKDAWLSIDPAAHVGAVADVGIISARTSSRFLLPLLSLLLQLGLL